MDISGLSKPQVLAALYNRSHVQGLGLLNARSGSMSVHEAAQLLTEQTYFDYLYGRVMKLDFDEGDELYTGLYNRDIGEGAAEDIITKLRAELAR